MQIGKAMPAYLYQYSIIIINMFKFNVFSVKKVGPNFSHQAKI